VIASAERVGTCFVVLHFPQRLILVLINSTVKRITQERFVKDSKPTIGVEFGEKIVERQGKFIRCQIWYVFNRDNYIFAFVLCC